VFGSVINRKGFKVIKGCGVIQGDGIDISVMHKVREGGWDVLVFMMGRHWNAGVHAVTCTRSAGVMLQHSWMSETCYDI
jgi:hypothetical protein